MSLLNQSLNLNKESSSFSSSQFSEGFPNIQKTNQYKNKQFEFYQKHFSFFQSKPINHFIQNSKIHKIIHFRDMQLFDNANIQYLKRYYNIQDSLIKVPKIFEYYSQFQPKAQPNLLVVKSYQVLKNRKKKLNKFKIESEKSQKRFKQKIQMKKNKAKNSLQNSKQIIFLENLDQISSQNSIWRRSQSANFQISYASSAYDIYQQYERQITSPLVYNKNNVLNVEQINALNLIINFKEQNVNGVQSQKKLNQLESSIELNDKDMKRLIESKQTKYKTYQNTIMQLASQSSTETGSFIQYYSTIQKKPTNLMQKYLHRKNKI